MRHHDSETTLTLTAYLQSTKAPWTSLLMVTAGQRAESLVRPPTGLALKDHQGPSLQDAGNTVCGIRTGIGIPRLLRPQLGCLGGMSDRSGMAAGQGLYPAHHRCGPCVPQRRRQSMKPFLRSCAMRERPGEAGRQEWAHDERRHFTYCSLYRNGRKPSGPTGG